MTIDGVNLARGTTGRRARPLLGTLVDIQVQGATPARMDQAINRAFAVVQTVHVRMSYHDPVSDVARLNRMGPGTATVDAHTWNVLAEARRIAEASDGRFDVTVAPELVRHGYLPRHADGVVPDPDASWRDIELLPENRVRLARPLLLDLGGIAKGYAVDCAVQVLLDAGMTAGRVNAGGDLRVFGTAEETLHVRHPGIATRLLPLCRIGDGAVATSATYYTRRKHRAGTVSPLIDTASRTPCVAPRSVSVFAARCTIADALTKVVFADPDAALDVLQRLDAHAAILDVIAGSARYRAIASGPTGWHALMATEAEAA